MQESLISESRSNQRPVPRFADDQMRSFQISGPMKDMDQHLLSSEPRDAFMLTGECVARVIYGWKPGS